MWGMKEAELEDERQTIVCPGSSINVETFSFLQLSDTGRQSILTPFFTWPDTRQAYITGPRTHSLPLLQSCENIYSESAT